MDGWFHVFGAVALNEQAEHHRLNESDESQRGRRQSGGIAHGVHRKPHQEAPNHDRPSSVVTSEESHEVHI